MVIDAITLYTDIFLASITHRAKITIDGIIYMKKR